MIIYGGSYGQHSSKIRVVCCRSIPDWSVRMFTPKKNWRSNFMSRSVVFSVTWSRCVCFAEQGLRQDIIYDLGARGYRLEQPALPLLNNSEILAVCKILMGSRSMRQDEMLPILDKLISCCLPEESKRVVKELLSTEQNHYVERTMVSTFSPACGRSAGRCSNTG